MRPTDLPNVATWSAIGDLGRMGTRYQNPIYSRFYFKQSYSLNGICTVKEVHSCALQASSVYSADLTRRDIKGNWAPSSEFMSSSIPSWQILTAHVQPFRGARDLAFCLKVPLDSLLVWASSGGSDETAPMRRLAWTFAARIGDKYQIRLTGPNYKWFRWG